MARFGSPSFHGLASVVNTVRRAQSGGVLNLSELLQVAGVLRTMRGVAEWGIKAKGCKPHWIGGLNSFSVSKEYLEDRIQTTVASEEEVADHASPELAAIRRKNRNASSRVREQLDHMIRSTAYQKDLTGHNRHHAGRPLCGAG